MGWGLNELFRLFIQKDYQKQQSLSSLVIFPFYFALETDLLRISRLLLLQDVVDF